MILFLIKIDLFPSVITRFRLHFLKMDSGQKEMWKHAMNPIKPEIVVLAVFTSQSGFEV